MDTVDVVLLTFNSERKLQSCLESVYQNVPVATLLAVDGGSTDQTLPILSKFSRKYGNVKIIMDKKGTRATARQKGIENVKSEWFVFVDSDVVLSTNWYQKAKTQANDDVGAVWGIEVWSTIQNPKTLKMFLWVTRKIFDIRGGTHDTLIRTHAVEGIQIPWRGVRAWLVRSRACCRGSALALALVALGAAAAGRCGRARPRPRGVDIVLAIDISPSMRREDFRPRNRLDVARDDGARLHPPAAARPHRAGGLRGHRVHPVPAHARPRRARGAARRPRLRARRGRHRDRHGARDRGRAAAREPHAEQGGRAAHRRREQPRRDRSAHRRRPGARAAASRSTPCWSGRGGVVPVPVDDPVLGRAHRRWCSMDVDERPLREIARRTGGRFFRATDAGGAGAASTPRSTGSSARRSARSCTASTATSGPLLLGAGRGRCSALYALSAATWAFRAAVRSRAT